MNFDNQAETDTQFQLAPMIDIIFLLLIFFVATYTVAQEERTLDISLPAANAAEEQVRGFDDIIINLDATGRITLFSQVYSAAQLNAKLTRLVKFVENPDVIIRADGACKHRHVVQIYDLCAALDRKSTRLNSSHIPLSRMPSSA